MEAAKETAANIGASAKSGKEKTKAIIQEKMENMTAHTQVEKEEAEKKKQERVRKAEAEKLEAMEENAAAREQIHAGYGHPGDHRRSPAVPGEDHVEAGVASSRPIGLDTGTGTPAAAHNPRVGSTHPDDQPHGTGGA
ncbi:hypothetical protein J5N97_006483 [Dioscorea zingiberensis]|uniref:Uncharacterized protein n=1 Tax=Dioscorea zingiberensis TaxID=325984 RepID=A0A9D5HU26_9LILI|nr:hypothetical protein J5N97_006483 [Dioscorea zingiberensis]